jgi:hypothetical protein
MWHASGIGGVYWVLVEKPEGKMPLGEPGYILDDNIKTDLMKNA